MLKILKVWWYPLLMASFLLWELVLVLIYVR